MNPKLKAALVAAALTALAAGIRAFQVELEAPRLSAPVHFTDIPADAGVE